MQIRTCAVLAALAALVACKSADNEDPATGDETSKAEAEKDDEGEDDSEPNEDEEDDAPAEDEDQSEDDDGDEGAAEGDESSAGDSKSAGGSSKSAIALSDFPLTVSPGAGASGRGEAIYKGDDGRCYVGEPPAQRVVNCPPAMNDPAFAACKGGTIKANTSKSKCVCVVPGAAPRPVGCPAL